MFTFPFISSARIVETNNYIPTLSSSQSRLIVNGVRGVGGVTKVEANSITFDLFDLEEDEDT